MALTVQLLLWPFLCRACWTTPRDPGFRAWRCLVESSVFLRPRRNSTLRSWSRGKRMAREELTSDWTTCFSILDGLNDGSWKSSRLRSAEAKRHRSYPKPSMAVVTRELGNHFSQFDNKDGMPFLLFFSRNAVFVIQGSWSWLRLMARISRSYYYINIFSLKRSGNRRWKGAFNWLTAVRGPITRRSN